MTHDVFIKKKDIWSQQSKSTDLVRDPANFFNALYDYFFYYYQKKLILQPFSYISEYLTTPKPFSWF